MRAKELKIALAMAIDSDRDLSRYDDAALDGCGLPDFEPVEVSLGAVARLLCGLGQWRLPCQPQNHRSIPGSWELRKPHPT